MKKKYKFKNQKNIVDGIAVNPKLPKNFYDTPNEERSDDEVNEWWTRAFITTQKFGKDDYKDYCKRMRSSVDNGTYVLETKEEFKIRRKQDKKDWFGYWNGGVRFDVRILDGGAWDRPTAKGQFNNLDDAVKLAKRLNE